MHEVRVDVPKGRGREIAKLALAAGISRQTVYSVEEASTGESREVVSVETSTPRASVFLDLLLASPLFDPASCSVTAREVRAIIDQESMVEVTRPSLEPTIDVIEDLWQLSHITPSYLGRATGAAILLAHGMIENSPIAIVVAALFLPFLSQLLASAIGAWERDWALARHGARAILVSTVISIAAGAAVAHVVGGTLQFRDFKSPLVSFAISLVIGVAAGLGITDDAGRRYLIGVAAAVQFSIFPAWFGICLVRGFPPSDVVLERLTSFGINIATIALSALAAYAFLRMRRTHRVAKRN
jgi:Domain of unknown function (DUF389)